MPAPDPVFTLPDDPAPQSFTQAPEAVAHLIALYERASAFLCEKFISVLESGDSSTRYRAFYPEVRITTSSYASVDSRLSLVMSMGRASLPRPSPNRACSKTILSNSWSC
jgi:AMP nucleosidase